MSNMSLLYNQVVNLTANSFTKTGHRFDGWSGSNGTNYNDKASVTKLSTTNKPIIRTFRIQYKFQGPQREKH